MVDSIVVQDIAEDANFQELVDDNTDVDEFTRLVNEHVNGYSQKKRLLDGLKDFSKKVEDAENRLIVAKNVGKFKGPDPEDAKLTNKSSSFELKQKTQVLSVQIETMISEGSITSAEKPHVLENLRTRLAKAKEAGKPKLEEKLDKMLTDVAKANGFSIPLANIEQFHQLDVDLRAIAKLEKLSVKNLTEGMRERFENKATIQSAFDALEVTSRMWFETPLEFKPRLSEAMAEWAANEEERKRKQEEEAWQKKQKDEEEALEKKRAEAENKKNEAAKALEDKLKAKRLEAAAMPVKEVPKAKPKEKKAVATLDLKEVFQEEIQTAAEQRAAADSLSVKEVQADLEAKAREREKARLYQEMKQATAEAEAAKKERAIKDTKANKEAERKAAKKVEELKTAAKNLDKPAAVGKASAAPAPKTAEEKQAEADKKFKAMQEKLEAKRLEAESKPKKQVTEPPKKKEKAQTKMSLLDFYADDPLLDNLAAQAAKEQTEKEAAQKEAARLAAEEEAAQAAAEEAALAEQEEAAAKAREEKLLRAKLLIPGSLAAEAASSPPTVKTAPAAEAEAVKPAPAPAPKPKRKPPVEIESKWGVPAAPKGVALLDFSAEDPLLEALASQQAQETAEREAAEREAAAAAAEKEEEGEEEEPAPTKIEVKSSATVPSPSMVQQASPGAPAPKPKPKRKPPVEIESKWGAPAAIPAGFVLEEDGDMPALGESMPSLADALTAPKAKAPQPQPKKKEKKKWGKVDANLLGFDADNPN